jgi:predicted RNase H-like nuclease (RuvC/YqgF family)
MTKPTGGRGNKAPYESTHVRVPIPIKKEVQALIDEFRDGQFKQAVKPLTALEENDDDEDEDHDEDEDNSDPSDLETIRGQADMIQRYASEIHSLKRELQDLNPLTSLDEAKESARIILRSKKSASQSLTKLLTSIYQVEVTIDDLR